MTAAQPYVVVSAIKAAVAGRETDIIDKLKIAWRSGSPHIRCPYLGHVDKHASWRWDPEKARGFCTCSAPASIFDVIMRVEGCDFSKASVRAAELIDRTDLIRGDDKKDKAAALPGCSIADYAAAKRLPEEFLRSLGLADSVYARAPAIRISYRGTAGTEMAVRYRVALDGADKFRWAKGARAVPYGLDRLGEAKDAGFVVIVEGESDAQTLWLHGFPAIGLPGATTWNEDRDAPLLDGINTIYIVIEPDTGGAAVLKWLRRSSIALRARLVRLKETKDPSGLHVLDPEGFRAAFQRALDEAPPFTPPADHVLKEEAKSGRALELPEPEPWPEPVDGSDLLDKVAAGIRRYVVLEAAAVDATALWCVGTHLFNGFSIFPRLAITSPLPRCGKTTLLDAIERLVPRALAAASITAPALFRTIEAVRPTLLLDEADTFAKDDENIRGVLNSGHRRNGTVIRVVESGKDYEPRQFSTWAPIALASIGNLPTTVMDRSVVVALRRRRPDEPAESLRLDRPNGLDRLARMAARWAADHSDAVRDADPTVPDGIYNRAADNWRPLFTIADIAGGDWPERARKAALALSAEHTDESRRVQLLVDIHAAFEVKGVDKISSDDLVTYLISLDDRPWAEWSRGRPLSKNQLARLVKPLGVSSGSIRLDDGRTPKGYYRAAFDDAFARYLPEDRFPIRNNATSEAEPSVSADSKTPHPEPLWRFETPKTPSVSAGCGVVADEQPGEGEFGAESAAQRSRVIL
jgi:Protein of unknown function (DUF3631)